MTIAEYINLNVAHVYQHTGVAEAAREMRDRQVGSLVVIEDTDRGRIPVGILTDRDLVLAVIAEDRVAPNMRVGSIMSRELVTIRAEESVAEALRLMRRHGVRRLPVISDRGSLLGIVSLDDLLGVVADQVTDMVQAIRAEREHEQRVGSVGTRSPGPAA